MHWYNKMILKPYAAGGKFGQHKINMQTILNMTETRNPSTWVLSESHRMNTNMIGFRWFSKIFASLSFGQKYNLITY